ncbi:hypothetical protein BKA69DRAFT_1098647 [Paraphysoderma sedebokerense]|nr:hypothetical protein BKA69DRAFT_1098647 [Paraphysoderma sedebokerense]
MSAEQQQPQNPEIAALQQKESATVFEHSFADHPHARTLLLAVDGSIHSKHAYEWTIKNILKKDDTFVLVNVRQVAYPVAYMRGAGASEYLDAVKAIEDQARERSHTLLREYGVDLKARGYNVRAIAIRGEPRTDIIAKAEDIKADAIIVGSRGLGAIKRTFLGSTSDYIVHHSHIPVIIVTPEAEQKPAQQ